MFASRLRRSVVLAAPLATYASTITRSSSSASAVEHFDYLVVGGSGGVASARRAALYGKRVALVERGPSRDARAASGTAAGTAARASTSAACRRR